MDSLLIRRQFSRNVLLRLALFSLLLAALIVWNMDYVTAVYFHKQINNTGHYINGTITALFLIGILRVAASLFDYLGEERALFRFLNNLEQGDSEDPLRGVSRHSLIAHRYQMLLKAYEARAPINQGALAATLVAAESSHNSTPRYINNILILCGVFGTIVALSLALLSASNMLENDVNAEGIGMVFFALSTAQNATISAIIYYIFLGYFNMKLGDVQTNLISGIEQVTHTYLMPRFQVKTENVLYEFTGLIRALQGLVEQMEDTQEGLVAMEEKIMSLLEAQTGLPERLLREMHGIKHILTEGFRLANEE